MKSIAFCKFHGFGNDYIVLEGKQIGLPDLGRRMCNRHTGVGSDGIAVLEKMDDGKADYACEIVNPDGSIAGFSGNGTRCAAAYLYYKELWSDKNLKLHTRSGIKNYRLIETIADGRYRFEAEIGKPKFSSAEVPINIGKNVDSVIDEPIILSGETFNFSAVNVGNPVACVFVNDFDFDWRKIGNILETHEAFPERINAVFVKVLDRENIELRIWERGAGETSASGTCASGAVVLCAFTSKTDRRVSVHTEGGRTEVAWREDVEILLTGEAELAFCGEWQL